MTSPTNRTTATAEPESEARPRLDLSLPKVAAGALASVTTAVVASFFGVTGTLTGAAFGSVVSSVAAAVYATSLQTAGTRIRASRTIVRRSAGGGDDPQDPTVLPPELTGRSVPLPGETTVLPASELPNAAPGHGNGGWQQDPYGRWQHQPPSGAPHGSPYGAGGWPNTPETGWPQGAASPTPRQRPRRTQPSRPAWQPVAMMAGFVFLVAMGVIFGTELVLGHPLSNTQETGTTVTRLVGVDHGTKPPSKDDDKKPEKPTTTTTSSTESSESPSPSGSASSSDEATRTTDETTTSSSGKDEGGQGGQSGQDQGGQGDKGGQTDQPTTTGDGANPPPATPSGDGKAAGDGGAANGDAGNGDVRGAADPTSSPGA